MDNKVCQVCGHESEPGDEVITEFVRIHDTRWDWRTNCVDIKKCWGRWDAQNLVGEAVK